MTTGQFRLSGKFDPNEITRVLQIEPTSSARIGDPGPPDAEGALWVLSASEESAGDIADQLLEIITPLTERADIVAELSSRHNGVIELISFRDSKQDSWFLSKDVLGELSRLGVSLRCWNETTAQHEALKEWLRAN